MRRLWVWANDRDTRRFSYHSDPIPWEDHQQWFTGKLRDPGCRLYIGMRGAVPIGQARFEARDDRRAEVHIAVAPAVRGRGYGASLLRLGCRRALRDLRVSRIVAYVKDDNGRSLTAFRAAGFRRVRRVTRHDAVSSMLIYGSDSDR